ncbi:putative WD repeat protein 17 [Blattamonas nauphoetae]|uniref:WD repeat protein 17 n=1 Tax=Blattamonas nauphoetae TaxID=2049346 RepID=A0ABQ9YHH9_9EUKA|nr:putative WD repeat protein 17 [Blattamonas nauphoetae]
MQETNNLEKILNGPDAQVSSIAWSPFDESALAADPLSPNFLLVALDSGYMSLFDVTQANDQEEIAQFDRESGGINDICWIPWEPGSFVTASARAGILKFWNVSQKQPVGQVVVGQSGLRSLWLFANYHKLDYQSGHPASHHVLHQAGKVTDPQLFVSSLDGSTAIFDLKDKFIVYSRSGGSSNTVFAVEFDPSDKRIFATAGFDGCIRLYNTDVQQCVDFYDCQIGPINTLAWGPVGSRKIVVSSRLGKVMVFDVDKHAPVFVKDINKESSSNGIAWNHDKAKKVVAVSNMRKEVLLFSPDDGKVQHKITHPAGVCGVDWNPFDTTMLASGCHDNHVRIFTITFDADGEVTDSKHRLTLKSHQARVYNVAFSPLVPGLLASGSDDQTIKVWDVPNCVPSSKGTNEQNHITLYGHEKNVRALRWSPEFPHILFSGSWDSTIRVWNVKQGSCISVVRDHHADVYGLAVHPLRPFTFVSCSRDTSLRIWEDTLATSIRTQFVLGDKDSGNSFANPVPTEKNMVEAIKNGYWDGPIKPTVKLSGAAIVAEALQAKASAGVKPKISSKSDDKEPKRSKTPEPEDSEKEPPKISKTRSSSSSRLVSPASLGATPMTALIRETIKETRQMFGLGSEKLRASLSSLTPNTTEYISAVVDFFCPPNGYSQLFDLIGQMQRTKNESSSSQQPLQPNTLYSVPQLTPSLLPSSFCHSSFITHSFLNEAILFSAPRGRKLRIPGMSDSESQKHIKALLAVSPHQKGNQTDKLKRAGLCRLIAGDVRGYCGLLVQSGDWMKALALAPCVSLEYWKELLTEVEEKKKELSEKADKKDSKLSETDELAFLIAAGKIPEAIKFLLSHKMEVEAFCLCESYKKLTNGEMSDMWVNSTKQEADKAEKSAQCTSLGIQTDNAGKQSSLTSAPIVDALAQRYLSQGQPIYAACCFLAADDTQQAIRVLEKAGESEIASACAHLLNLPFHEHTHVLAAFRCERYFLWALAMETLQRRVPESFSKRELYGLAIRFGTQHSEDETDAFYKQAGLGKVGEYKQCFNEEDRKEETIPDRPPSPSQSLTPITVPAVKQSQLLNKLTTQFGSKLAPLIAASLSQNQKTSAELGVALIRQEMRKDNWELSEMKDVLFWLSSVGVDSLSVPFRNEILSYSAYLGCVEASWRALTPVLAHLFNYTSSFIEKSKIHFLVPRDYRKVQAAVFTLAATAARAREQLTQIVNGREGTVTVIPSGDSEQTSSDPETMSIKKIAGFINSNIDAYPHPGISHHNTSIPMGSTIPSGGSISNPVPSLLTHQPINGPPFWLADGKSALSVSEALMWAQVNPFSPLNTGERINPF